jgi:hypothetical protein
MKSSLETSCLYFSSFSILLIAIDRSITIIYPTYPKISNKKVPTFIFLFTIYHLSQAYALSLVGMLLSLAMTSPLLVLTKYEVKIDLRLNIINTSCVQVNIFCWRELICVISFVCMYVVCVDFNCFN